MEATMSTAEIEDDMDVDDETTRKRCRFPRRRAVKLKKVCAKEERSAFIKKVSLIMQKATDNRTSEEAQMLLQYSEAVEEVQSRWRKRDEAKRRLEEYEESAEVLREKCQILAQAIAQSQHLVVYTGAGISTAARIPDYRGSNGIWTRLQQGKEIGDHDLSLAEPTYTHMALSKLYQENILKYVVSQNCDGLHLRSGLPRSALSELHGNMYIEVCKTCKPAKEYWRIFDVTENTARFFHKTTRKCYTCNAPLVDTIVHFGERGSLQWPLNWTGASKNAQKATTILCLGSSLKVLKKYPWLWQMYKPAKKRPNLYIVNLQWTPKDDCANVKIHGKCDEVMEIIMSLLGISVPGYNRKRDPIFYHATSLCEKEQHTTTQPLLKASDISEDGDKKCNTQCDTIKIKTEERSELIDCKPRDKCHSTQSNALGCDTICNKISVKSSPEANRPPPNGVKIEQPPVALKSSFSIASILNTEKPDSSIKNEAPSKDAQICSNFLNNGLFLPQNLMAYYPMQLQNPFLTYPEVSYYPYQTSFLYSGLHSIINPLPFFKSECDDYSKEFNYTLAKITNNTESFTNGIAPVKELKPQPSCDFCKNQFQSTWCLFYPNFEATFLKPDDTGIICVCCEFSSDEHSPGEEEESKDGMEMGGSDSVDEIVFDEVDESKVLAVVEKEQSDCLEKDQGKIKIQAGWFGKGYRKNRKHRKK